MIAFLRGTVVERGGDFVVVDVGGVGYLVQVSLQTLTALARAGEQAHILIHSHQAQDAPLALFGFATAEERSLFELLISVHGVGPRLAQTLLSGFAPGQLQSTIAKKDVAALRRVRGVGAKTAERVVLELKDKIGTVRSSEFSAHASESDVPEQQDLVRTLVGLGYKTTEAEKAVARIADRASRTPPELLLREALKEIQTG